MSIRSFRRMPFAVACALAASLLWTPAARAGGGGCYEMTRGRGTTVELKYACFTPGIIRVARGSSVTFVNRDDYEHNVSAVGWGWYQGLSQGEAFRASFRKPGVYPFACTIHPMMAGAVIVGDGTGAGNGRWVRVEPFVAAAQSEGPPAAPPSQGREAVVVTTTRTTGWWLGGAFGLLIGFGAALLTRGRRRRPGRSRPAGAAA